MVVVSASPSHNTDRSSSPSKLASRFGDGAAAVVTGVTSSQKRLFLVTLLLMSIAWFSPFQSAMDDTSTTTNTTPQRPAASEVTKTTSLRASSSVENAASNDNKQPEQRLVDSTPRSKTASDQASVPALIDSTTTTATSDSQTTRDTDTAISSSDQPLLSTNNNYTISSSSSLAERRTVIEQMCQAPLTGNAAEDSKLRDQLMENLAKFFAVPSQPQKPRSETDPVQPCTHVFMDFGANIGDSFGKFIDSNFPISCPILSQDKSIRLNLDSGRLEIGKSNQLVNVSRALLQSLNRTTADYCYVGIEGNPVFTKRLQELEARVMGSEPRPIAAAHFYTESVGAGADGPTILYLDTVNKGVNFWGSSIIPNHRDVIKSAKRNNGAVEAHVMGLTLTTLLRRAVQKVPGAHVLLKIDIEGGEFVLLNEAVDALCDYSKAGVRIDMMVEVHPITTFGKTNEALEIYHNTTKHKILECNIGNGNLDPKYGT